MGGCRCTYRNCSLRTDGKTHMFHYPVFDKVRCHQWLTNAHKLEFLNLKVSQLKNRVVCQHHFKDDCFMNFKKDKLTFDAVPTEDGPYCDSSQKGETKPEQEESKVFSITLDDIENEYLTLGDKKANFSVKYGDFLTNCDLMDLDSLNTLNQINDNNQIALKGLCELESIPRVSKVQALPKRPVKTVRPLTRKNRGKRFGQSSSSNLKKTIHKNRALINGKLRLNDDNTVDISQLIETPRTKERKKPLNIVLNVSHVPVEFENPKSNGRIQENFEQSKLLNDQARAFDESKLLNDISIDVRSSDQSKSLNDQTIDVRVFDEPKTLNDQSIDVRVFDEPRTLNDQSIDVRVFDEPKTLNDQSIDVRVFDEPRTLNDQSIDVRVFDEPKTLNDQSIDVRLFDEPKILNDQSIDVRAFEEPKILNDQSIDVRAFEEPKILNDQAVEVKSFEKSNLLNNQAFDVKVLDETKLPNKYADKSLLKGGKNINNLSANDNTNRSLLKQKKKIRIISEKKISEPVPLIGNFEPLSPTRVLTLPNKRRICNPNPLVNVPEVPINSAPKKSLIASDRLQNEPIISSRRDNVSTQGIVNDVVDLIPNEVLPINASSQKTKYDVRTNKSPNDVSPQRSLLKNKIPPERVAAIAEKRKFNMKLRDIIEDCLDKLDGPEAVNFDKRKTKTMQSKQQQVGSYFAKSAELPSVQDYTIAYLEARMKKMENTLLNKIEENSQKIVDLKQAYAPSCGKKNVHTQTSISEDIHKKQLYQELSKYLSPEANSLVYEELFINKYSKDVPQGSPSIKRRRRR